MSRSRRTALLLVLVVLPLTGCGGSDDEVDTSAGEVTADIKDANNGTRGTVQLAFSDKGYVTVTLETNGLKPGLHGLHVHQTGVCEQRGVDPANPGMPGFFLSAGGHIAEGEQVHGDHDGDLPTLLVRADGSARMVVESSRLTREEVLDGDGSALIIHEKPDNFGNIPDRYTTAIDDTTKKTGDAGTRIACAVLKD